MDMKYVFKWTLKFGITMLTFTMSHMACGGKNIMAVPKIPLIGSNGS